MPGAAVIAASIGVALLAFGSPAIADFDNCGERSTAHGATKIIKAKSMSCSNAQDLAIDYEQKAFDGQALAPGDVTKVRRFRCKYVTYFDPFERAYQCGHTRQQGKKMAAHYPPEREGNPGRAQRGGATPCATLLDGSCRVKPRKLTLGARGVMRFIDWDSWGGQKAVGYGKFHYVPSAAPDEFASNSFRMRIDPE